MQITFFGAAGEVTGSKHLLQIGKTRLLLDCGSWQGVSAEQKNQHFPFAPPSLNGVIISHAHLDHSVLLPKLVAEGYTGPIYTTPATRDVIHIMLKDAAKIEEQDTAYQIKHGLSVVPPLFTLSDIAPTIEHCQIIPYARTNPTWTPITANVRLKFYDAGHIIGSAITVLEIQEGDTLRYLAYTGDVGPPGLPLLHDPELPQEPIDTLILESTYGSHTHESLDIALDRLATTVNKICQRGGKIIVPAFSLGRTQALVYLLHKLTNERKIPRLPIYVDSPLATDIAEVVEKDYRNYDQETWQDFAPGDTPLAFPNLTYIRSVDQSKALNTQPGPFLIIAASGMMTAGRVIHHLRHSIADPKNALLITGYQAEGTLGRKIIDGAKEIELHGDRFPVRAEAVIFNEFSAHADQHDLQLYAEAALRNARTPTLLLVHGEPHQADDLSGQLKSSHPTWNIYRPSQGDTINL